MHFPVGVSYHYDLFTIFSCWFLSTGSYLKRFSALLFERKVTPWNIHGLTQLTATGRRFTALALSTSPCCNTKLYPAHRSRWGWKILLPKCFGRTSGRSLWLPILLHSLDARMTLASTQTLQLHTVVLSTVDFILNTSTFLKMVKVIMLAIYFNCLSNCTLSEVKWCLLMYIIAHRLLMHINFLIFVDPPRSLFRKQEWEMLRKKADRQTQPLFMWIKKSCAECFHSWMKHACISLESFSSRRLICLFKQSPSMGIL